MTRTGLIAATGMLLLAACDPARTTQVAQPPEDGPLEILAWVGDWHEVNYGPDPVVDAVADPEALVALGWGDQQVWFCCQQAGVGSITVTLLDEEAIRFYTMTMEVGCLQRPNNGCGV